jgi:hypothetical protein
MRPSRGKHFLFSLDETLFSRAARVSLPNVGCRYASIQRLFKAIIHSLPSPSCADLV